MPLFRPGWTAGMLQQSSGCFNAVVAQGTWIRGFSLFCEWHQDRIMTNGRRLVGGLSELYPTRTTTERKATLRRNNAETNRMSEYNNL